MFLGSSMHVMMQTLEGGDRPCLPHSLSIMNTYTEMTTGSMGVAVIVKNMTAALITIIKGVTFAWFMAVTAIPPVGVVPGTLEKLYEMQGVQRAKLSVEHRREVLFCQLNVSDLEGWFPKNWAATCILLAEYHNIISLEPGDLGCTEVAKHKIKVIDGESFKERFRRIPPSMVDEFCAHVKEVLEAGLICPSQSPWCNAVVLVHKKDGGLCFCINFCKLNVRTKEDSYLLPWIQEAIEGLVGTGYFSCLDLKAGFWQITMDEVSKQYTAFTMGNIGFFEWECMLFGLCNTMATFQRQMQNCKYKYWGLCHLVIAVVIWLLTGVLTEHRQVIYVYIYIYYCMHIKLTWSILVLL